MTPFSKWKTIGYAVAIFIAGGVSGGALGIYETRAHLFAPPGEEEVAFRLRNRLRTRLGLSPDQVDKIDPIIQSAVSELRAIRVETAQRVHKVFDGSYAQISAILTPEQRSILQQIQKERLEMMRRNQGGHWANGLWHAGPGAPDGGGPNGQPHGGPEPSAQ